MNTPEPTAARPALFLIDGNSQMYRAYHAIRGLTGPDGRSTNAVYGFVTMLRKLLAEQRPELIACAFDLAGPTFRSTLAADYKANRPAMPGDLAEQIPQDRLGHRIQSDERDAGHGKRRSGGVRCCAHGPTLHHQHPMLARLS